MKILYIANARMPTEKAHGLQIMKMCQAFANLGHEVTLVIPHRRNIITDDPFRYYGIQPVFRIQRAWSWDLVQYGRIGFLIQYATFSVAASLVVDVSTADLIFGRDELTLLFIAMTRGVWPVWESHDGAWNRAARSLASRVRLLVVVSKGSQELYESKGVPELSIKVAPNGIDLAQFAHPESRADSRRRLGLPLAKKIVLYIGRLDGWKGVDTLCQAAALLPPEILVAIIGGEEKQIATMKSEYPLVSFLGYRPYRELADNQAAADVLVIPNTGRDETSVRFTSPLKLFTYMASKVPIVASDLPSIREILNEQSAIFFAPDDPHSLADAVREVFADPAHSSERARNAREQVNAYTWHARAEAILEALR
jgi:glycosyltransferase involved in cell wall biosynthesis